MRDVLEVIKGWDPALVKTVSHIKSALHWNIMDEWARRYSTVWSELLIRSASSRQNSCSRVDQHRRQGAPS